ncbi:hypothetical protein ACFVWR_07030 [Leifsonia sp. NPDC058292]|uniref:hypothetical protein n=1 Tax=Leifsonia sp. NPDC058292 TaxID=3346428 RepID=UPI0036D9F274
MTDRRTRALAAGVLAGAGSLGLQAAAETSSGRLRSIALTVLLVALAAGVIAALVGRSRGSPWKSRRTQGFVVGVCIAAVIAGLLLIFL